MELNDLKSFLAIAREGSISKAATSLYMSQSNLSRQMQKVENEIGKLLFIRGNKKITLTDEGVLLRKRAEEILSLYEKTENELKTDSQTISGDIYIGGGESPAISLIAECAKKINEKYPDIIFRFYSGDSLDITDKLDKGIIDFGIYVDPQNFSPSYEYLFFPKKDVWGLLIRTDSPLADKESIESSDLVHLPLIISNQGLENGLLKSWFGIEKKDLHISATYNLLYNASLLVKEGLGNALCIQGIIKEDDSITFRPFSPQKETSLALAYKKTKTLSKAASFFLDTIKSTLN